MARTRRELDTGDLSDALVTAMRAAEMGPSPLLRLPRPVLRFLARRMLAARPRAYGPVAEPGQGTEPAMLTEPAMVTEPAMRDLAYALRADFAIVAGAADRLAAFRTITTPVLLVDGTRTRPYLRAAVEALARTIPDGRRVSLAGTDHGVTRTESSGGARSAWRPSSSTSSAPVHRIAPLRREFGRRIRQGTHARALGPSLACRL